MRTSIRLPTSSRLVYPNIVLTCSFTRLIRPASSTTMTASGENRKKAASMLLVRWDFSLDREFCWLTEAVFLRAEPTIFLDRFGLTGERVVTCFFELIDQALVAAN